MIFTCYDSRFINHLAKYHFFESSVCLKESADAKCNMVLLHSAVSVHVDEAVEGELEEAVEGEDEEVVRGKHQQPRNSMQN